MKHSPERIKKLLVTLLWVFAYGECAELRGKHIAPRLLTERLDEGLDFEGS
jgi:hypothetical protein